MHHEIIHALRRFRRVQEFLATNAIAGTTVQQQVLHDVVRQMSDTGEEQDANHRVALGETARQRAWREGLWHRHMVPIARIARRVFGIPGMDVKVFLPKKRSDNESVLDAARGMAQAAEAHAGVFVQQGLPADFVQQFRTAIDTLANGLGVRVESQRRRKTAGQTALRLVRRGVAAVEVLDAIVTPRLEGRPDLLAAWKSVKRPIEPGGTSNVGSRQEVTQPVEEVA